MSASFNSTLLNHPVHLGLKPVPILSLPKFKLSTYLDMTAISPPPVFGKVSGINWGMGGNDRAGDCVVAGAAHAIKVWCSQAGTAVPDFSDNTCLSQYAQLSGWDGGSGDKTDTGLDMNQFTSWWRQTGLKDDKGNTHKVLAYANVDSLDHLIKAVYAFGVCGLGINFPSTAMRQFDAQTPWTVVAGATNEGGHYIPIVARNSAGNLVCVTWSRLHAMTLAFIEAYAMCIIAYISPDYMINNVSPRALNLSQLTDDLGGLANA